MRTKTTKANKIKKMLEQGKSVSDIAKATGASAAYVYAVKSKVKKAKGLLSPPQNVSSPPQNVSLLARIINRIAFWR